MPDSLADLESRRAAVQLQIAQLGDMRSGSITRNRWPLWKSKLSLPSAR